MRDDLDPELARLFAEEPIPAPPAGAAARVLAKLPLALPPVLPTKWLGAKSLALAAGTFVLGGAVGVAVPRKPAVVYVDRAVVVVASAPAIASSAPQVIELPPEPSSAPKPRPVVDSLAAERAIMDAARADLSAGESAAALARLDEHRRRFPKGQLEEEREALAVQALANAGRPDAARARAATFRDHWPESMYRAAVDATLRSIP